MREDVAPLVPAATRNFYSSVDLPDPSSYRRRASTMAATRRKRLLCAGLGVGLVALGLLQAMLGAALGPRLLNYVVRSAVLLGPASPSRAFWQDIPVPLTTQVYLFNVSNPDEVFQGSAKPRLTEVGPFVYDEYHNKVNIRWNAANDSVTYQQVRTYFHRPELSSHPLDTNVTLINAVAATLGAIVSPMPGVERGLVNLGISIIKEKLFVTHPASEIIFDGYRDPLLDAAQELAKLGIHLPGEMDKFGIFYGRNGSDWYDGVFNMHVGRDNLTLANQMHAWNYTTRTDFFPSRCGDVRGNAEMFTPFLDDETAELYSNDLCRPMTMKYSENVNVKGVSGRRYEIRPAFFANRTVNEDNWCYEGGHEVPSGLFNASSCRFGAPVFISQPHFYQSDPRLLDQLQEGSLKPEKDKHETYFVINSVSGVPLEVVARFQVNLYIENMREMKLFRNVQGPLFVPAFWFETKMTLGGGMAAELWVLANLFYIIIGMGIVIGTIGVVIVMSYCWCADPEPASNRMMRDRDEPDELNREASEEGNNANVDHDESSTAPLVEESSIMKTD